MAALTQTRADVLGTDVRTVAEDLGSVNAEEAEETGEEVHAATFLRFGAGVIELNKSSSFVILESLASISS